MKNAIWIILVLFVALTAVHCGDDGDGDNGNDTSNLSAAEVAAGGCESEYSFDEDDCDGLDEYTDCVENQCNGDFENCLGVHYEDGDFSGSACEEFMDCVSEADDACDNDCELGEDCGLCLLDLGACVRDNCFSLLQCGGDNGGESCDDLDACCDSLGSPMQGVCEVQADAVKAGGDLACKILLDAYCS